MVDINHDAMSYDAPNWELEPEFLHCQNVIQGLVRMTFRHSKQTRELLLKA